MSSISAAESQLAQNKFFTVVVPITRMAGKLDFLKSWLPEALAANIQVILVHDIQDSETSGEIQKLVREYSSTELQFIEGHFGSPGAARNQGITGVQGDWVAFWDSDDQPNVQNFLDMVRLAEKEKADVAIGDFLRIAHPKDELDVIKGTRPLNLDSVFRDPGLWRFAFRTERLSELLFQDFLIGEDLIFLLESGYFTTQIFFFEEIVYCYSINLPGQATSSSRALADYSRTLEYLSPKLTNSGSFPFIVTYLKLLVGALKNSGLRASLMLVLKTAGAVMLKPSIWPGLIKASRLLSHK